MVHSSNVCVVPDLADPGVTHGPAEEFEVRPAAVIREEKILAVVAALNNFVRLTRNDDSGHARHADNLPLAGRKVSKLVTVRICRRRKNQGRAC